MKISKTTIENIVEASNDNIEVVFDALNIDYKTCDYNEIRTCCPVHNGDNSSAFLYSKKSKRWRCFTHDCHENRDSIFGLVCAIRGIKFTESVVWLANLLGIKVDKDKRDESDEIGLIVSKQKLELRIKNRFNAQKSTEKMRPIELSKMPISKENYFRKQGFNQNTIDRFHIGFCEDSTKPMFMRSFAPVLDDQGKYIIGVTGRTIFEKCGLCQMYHSPKNGCPTDGIDLRDYSKWKHFGFNAGSLLYNYSNAIESIQKTSLVIVTEGPKDVWWLYQHGVCNAVALLRKEIMEHQLNKLIQSGATRVILMLNNDEASRSIRDRTIRNLSKYFKVIDLTDALKAKDVAEVSSEMMKNEIIPLIKRWELNI